MLRETPFVDWFFTYFGDEILSFWCVLNILRPVQFFDLGNGDLTFCYENCFINLSILWTVNRLVSSKLSPYAIIHLAISFYQNSKKQGEEDPL